MKTDCNIKIKNFEDKIPNLATTTVLNAKICVLKVKYVVLLA